MAQSGESSESCSEPPLPPLPRAALAASVFDFFFDLRLWLLPLDAVPSLSAPLPSDALLAEPLARLPRVSLRGGCLSSGAGRGGSKRLLFAACTYMKEVTRRAPHQPHTT